MDEQVYINIAKDVNGEATEAELQQLNEWLSANPQNLAEYENLKAIWNQSDSIPSGPKFNTDAAWLRVSGKLQLDKTKKPNVISLPWVRYSLAAAAALLIGFFVIGRYQGARVVTIAAVESNMDVELPDNSHVMLRKGSTLSYPKSFSGSERLVALKGEAFFEVTRNEQKPFIIDAQSAKVQVLGTSFDVKCSEAQATVVVKTGRVQMSDNKTAASVILTPGEKGLLKDGRLVEQTARIDNVLYWQAGALNYSKTSLVEIIEELNQVKDTVIALDQNMTEEQKKQLIDISFKDQNLEAMLTDLCLVSQCQWSKSGDSYRVSAK
ncbi:FecR family protein [Polluticoccus soli]|uniref:FecR family protein n=1 Tax=Polluticoccus soli TaxID=3034150 RepID=UPI0023E11EEA|nr:FecR domain-containing protein [Flavipsychrobacter sp. JY13-12]